MSSAKQYGLNIRWWLWILVRDELAQLVPFPFGFPILLQHDVSLSLNCFFSTHFTHHIPLNQSQSRFERSGLLSFYGFSIWANGASWDKTLRSRHSNPGSCTTNKKILFSAFESGLVARALSSAHNAPWPSQGQLSTGWWWCCQEGCAHMQTAGMAVGACQLPTNPRKRPIGLMQHHYCFRRWQSWSKKKIERIKRNTQMTSCLGCVCSRDFLPFKPQFCPAVITCAYEHEIAPPSLFK